MADFNFTIIFHKWTFDFPPDFLAAFRDFSFKYEKLKFDVWYWREDPPIEIRELLHYFVFSIGRGHQIAIFRGSLSLTHLFLSFTKLS